MQSLLFLVFVLFLITQDQAFSLKTIFLCLQEAVDITKGLSRETVEKMALNLGFTGEKQAQVNKYRIAF